MRADFSRRLAIDEPSYANCLPGTAGLRILYRFPSKLEEKRTKMARILLMWLW